MISADLGQPLEAVVAELVANGRFGSSNDVLREGVRLVQEREARRTALQAAIDEGLADMAAGRTRPAEDVFAELEARYKAMSPTGK
ncbi:type II toxin-antitoxin system ParD family antitoxin [Sphingomonas sp. RIT328]|uniref:type II toxin-antitoxin system ParD family antitoxin n=1 Tax=Sphingomonas sp. RIT328 TaxID=1470591 RepID=UPI00044734F6|nr:type II toxin-antitoxin system ParD family antitoxin [Sphingomonas sp. RIT328]EZP49201.1 putative addiction module antidote protein, family [Sphingomonas sp. RIT328]